MKFKYRKYPPDPASEAHPSSKSILRPVIPIEIIHQSNKLKIYALVDSGSDSCIFPGSVGKALGLNVTKGKKESLSGLKGEPVLAYFHNITFKIGGWKYPCFGGFSAVFDKLPYGILGQNDFFSRFIVTLDYKKELIELKERKRRTKTNK